MLPKSILDGAKAFLCWDVFSDLSIQLVPLDSAIGFYYPPESPLHGIVLFYDPGLKDFSEPLFLLFHEAGHACQWQGLQQAGRKERFSQGLACPTGQEKGAFEKEAWNLGEELFRNYIRSRGLDERLAAAYAEYGRRCRASYGE